MGREGNDRSTDRSEEQIDGDRLRDMARTVFGAFGGAVTSAMIHLGDRLGLYRAMAEVDAVDSQALAEATGLSERWLREWLHQQGAAGVLDYRGDDRFALSPEGVAVLANESHPAFGAGFFSHFPQTMHIAERLPEAFETGVGLPYDAFGAEGAVGIERGFAPWFRSLLVPVALPRIEGLVPRLESGTTVADVGCGTGVAMIEMARAWPKSDFHGYELSQHAIDRGRANAADAGVSNVSFHHVGEDPLPEDERFGFVTTFDCLHDMTDPASVMAGIRGAIAPDGIWLIADIKSYGSYEANVAENPMAAMMYGTSVMTCMSSALSEPGGAGLGTLGLHADLMSEMVTAAGFRHFEELDFGHPVNAFYVARPE
jgi:2-polyprenyl-3-methyl-5-hydroxy-6-metoxy-1,4-benzoquinol methylase